VRDAIEECNRNWRERLAYEDFELEPEEHAAMLFVRHKNYLIWDVGDGGLKLTTKGNNFKGSDKANIAQIFLNRIMSCVVAENVNWDDPEEAQQRLVLSIKKNTASALDEMRMEDFDLNDFTMVQVVRPPRYYKPIESRTASKRINQQATNTQHLDNFREDGEPAAPMTNTEEMRAPATGETTSTPSVHAQRAMALEKLLDQPIRASLKMKFVVSIDPLPGITKLSRTTTREKYAKSGVKPIDYMYPLEYLQERGELEEKLDIDWYRDMVENYIRGAFGFEDLSTATQKGLDTWGEKPDKQRNAPRPRKKEGQVSLSDYS
jgi:hypothetical protein